MTGLPSLFLSATGGCLPHLQIRSGELNSPAEDGASRQQRPTKGSIKIFPTDGGRVCDKAAVRVAPRLTGTLGRSSIKVFPSGPVVGFKSDASSAPPYNCVAPQQAALPESQRRYSGYGVSGSLGVSDFQFHPGGRWK